MATSITVGGPPVTGTAADNQFFYEDEVFRLDKKGRVKFGLVLENSEAFSSDDEDDFEMSLSKGEIRVAWHPYGDEETLQERSVGLADRTLLPGDVVRRLVPGKDTQRGYCREISMRADVRVVGTKFVVKNVIGERLRPIQTIPRDNAVCLDSWVGSTKCINEKVVLMSSCGALIEVPDSELLQLKDVNTKYRNGLFSEPVFYPGQVVTGRLESLDNVKSLTTTGLKAIKKGKSRKFLVKSVQMEGLWVHWQCKALSEDSVDLKSGLLQQPKPYITGEDLNRLKRLNLFESCMLQINDKNYLKISDCDLIIRKSQWDKEQAIKYKLILSQQQKDESNVPTAISTNSSNPSMTAVNKVEKIKIKLLPTTVAEPEKKPKLQHNVANLRSNHNINLERIFPKERHETETKPCEKTDSKVKTTEEITESNAKKEGSDDWQTDDDEFDDDEDDSITDSATTNASSCSSPTPKSSPKHRPMMQKKQVKKLKKAVAALNNDKPPVVGDEVVTEALVVYSTATVVWQDGSIEPGIPSTQLYPIHHLDDHEYFPGDFVLSNVEGADVSYRDYGVIHSVDHQGRTAKVRWFTTYTSAEDPKLVEHQPSYKGESEVSVYDLKDHPDFQYRPGTIVIRVANFIGEDATCTAGQIVDNYADGRVKVWWVDGHISMCWPQDLFEVGQYDADNNFLGNNESDDSWETESEASEPGGLAPKTVSEPHLSENLERARIAIARLEEIFIMKPNLQNHEVMKKLLAVYKKCRYLDRLMNTSFFHEDHFMGLLEPVRKGGTQTKFERAQDQKNRLFNQTTPNVKVTTPTANHPNPLNSIMVEANSHNELTIISSPNEFSTPNREYPQNVILNLSSSPLKFIGKRKSFNFDSCPSKHSQQQQHQQSNYATNVVADSQVNPEVNSKEVKETPEAGNTVVTNTHLSMSSLDKKSVGAMKNNDEDAQQANTKEKIQTSKVASKSQDDSGNYSRNDCCDGSSTSYESSSDLTNDANNSLLKATDDQKSISCSSIEFTEDTPDYVCAHLCALLKAQLIKALQEIQEKYCQSSLNISEIVEAIEEDEIVENLEQLARMPSEEDTAKSTEEEVVDESEKSLPVATPVVPTPVDTDAFQITETAPCSHKFHLTIFHPANQQHYYKAVRREHRVLKSSLPSGVWVRAFEDRMDLLSIMIEGPKNTPYEDGLFFFDMQMGRDYPSSPPLCHYISYCSDRLNPNLYEDGKVCVSLLGTWSGRDSEVWSPLSTILQVIVSIQGLILVPEPYFNEAGFEKQKGSQQGKENSRMYNEMAILKLVQSMTKLLSSPPELFRTQIIEHFKARGKFFYQRIKQWMEYSQDIISPVTEKPPQDANNSSVTLPEFPLVPASRGFCLTLSGLLETFNRKLEAIIE